MSEKLFERDFATKMMDADDITELLQMISQKKDLSLRTIRTYPTSNGTCLAEYC